MDADEDRRTLCVCGYLVHPGDPLPAVRQGSAEDTLLPYDLWCRRHAHDGSWLSTGTAHHVQDNGDGSRTHTITTWRLNP